MVGVAANITINTDGITVDIAGDELKIPLNTLDETNMHAFGTFVLAAWRDHQQREIDRKYNMAKEFLEFKPNTALQGMM